MQTNELTLKPLLFKNYFDKLFWKVDFIITKNSNINGLASLTFLINQVPKNGHCFVDQYNGTSLSTTFNIKCLNWIDIDGSIERYEFFATYSGNENPIALNYNSNGDLYIQLPQGPDYDSYKLYLFVNIIDDTYGVTVYNIVKPVTVMPNVNLANNLAASIASNDPDSSFLQNINSRNLNLVAKNVIALTSVFNIQSLSTPTATASTDISTNTTTNAENDQKAALREFLIGKVAELSVSDMSSIKVIASALSSASANTDQISRNAAVCKNLFKNKKILFNSNKLILKELSISKSSEIVSYLNTMSSKITFDDLKQGLNGIFETIGNSLIVYDIFFMIK